MESFFRYVAYVDYYKKEERIRNVGFLRWKLHHGEHCIELQLKDVLYEKGTFDIKEQNTEKRIGKITIDKGIGSFVGRFPSMTASDEKYIETFDDRLYLDDVEGLVIWLDSDVYLSVPIKFEKEKKRNKFSELKKENITNLSEDKKKEERLSLKNENEQALMSKEILAKKQSLSDEKMQETEAASENILIEGIEEKYEEVENIKKREERKKLKFEKVSVNNIERSLEQKVKIIEPIHEDKWKQLCKEYSNVHPFPNNKVFLSIKPEDFIILQQKYQKLVHNSFLLHGFYNYGHMILGKLSEEEKAPVYIGVPGVYYEREKQAAQMFGFVGFESTEHPVQAGSYGYYMIEVEI